MRALDFEPVQALVRARPYLFVGIAIVLSAGLCAGAALAFVNASNGGPSTASVPLPTPTPTMTPPQTPTPRPTPTPSATAKASASPSARPTASPPGTGVRTYAYPKPTRSYDSLRFRAASTSGSGTSATLVTVTVAAKDGDGDITFGGLTWGDGTAEPAEAVADHCPSYPSPTAAPGPYQPKPSSRTFTRQHRYAATGTYPARVSVRSGNTSCRPNGPGPEAQTVTFTVHVG